jgi:hypothetical protein
VYNLGTYTCIPASGLYHYLLLNESFYYLAFKRSHEKRAEQVLPRNEEDWGEGEWGEGEEGGEMAQKCMHI